MFYTFTFNNQTSSKCTNIDIYIDRRPALLDRFVRVLHSFLQLELFTAHIDFNRQKSCTKVSKLSSCVNFFLSQLRLSPQLENKTKETVFKHKLLVLGFCSICPNFMTFYLDITPTIIFYEVENFAIVIFVTPPLSCNFIWKLIISILTTSCTKVQMQRKYALQSIS